MFLEKIDVRSIIASHVNTLRDYGTGKRSVSDWILFFAVPVVVAGTATLKGAHLRAIAVTGLLTAFSIFTGLLLNLIMTVLTFLRTTRGNPEDSSLRIRKQLLRDLAANLAFSILISVMVVAIAITALFGLTQGQDQIGPTATFLLVTGAAGFVLNLLMALRRIYALILNEFDRHKLNGPIV
jgi:hypothetical protein